MALSVVQTAKYTGTTAQTNMTFTLGTTPVVGNRLLFIPGFYTGDDPVLTPTGWTRQDLYEPNQAGLAVFYRDVQSGDGTSWNLNVMTAADQNSGYMSEITGGASGASFFNVAVGHSTTTTGTSLTTASVTPTVTGCLAIAAIVTTGTTSTDVASTPSGWTKDQPVLSTFQPAWYYHKTALTTDTTTAISAAFTSIPAGNISSVILLIAPSGGATPTTPKTLALMGVGV